MTFQSTHQKPRRGLQAGAAPAGTHVCVEGNPPWQPQILCDAEGNMLPGSARFESLARLGGPILPDPAGSGNRDLLFRAASQNDDPVLWGGLNNRVARPVRLAPRRCVPGCP